MSNESEDRRTIDAHAIDKQTHELESELQSALTRKFLLHSAGYSRDSEFGFDLYETAKQVSDSAETDLYATLMKEWENNDLAIFLVSHIVNRLMDFRFVGDSQSKEKVEEFFYRKTITSDLEQVATQSFILGTGLMQRFVVNQELVNVSRIDSTSIKIGKRLNKRTGELIYTYLQEVDTEFVNEYGDVEEQTVMQRLTAKNIAAFRPLERPDSAYGVSYMRGSLLTLQAMRQLQMDIPAGIKRLAYELMVLYLDLDNVQTEEEARTRIKRAMASFYKQDSATASVVATDKNNLVAYASPQTGGGKKIEPILPLVEPLLMTLLVKWHIPMGMFLQEKSNRALIESQASEAEMEIRKLQKKFAMFIEREIIAHILGTPEGERPVVRVEHNLNTSQMTEEMKVWLDMVVQRVIPVESFVAKFGIPIPEGDLTYLRPKDLIHETDTDEALSQATPDEKLKADTSKEISENKPETGEQ